VENVVLNKLQEHFDNIRFYRDSFRREIDFVINNVPIEVKWKSDVSFEDLRNILYFMSKHNLKKGIVVAKKFNVVEKNSKKIYILPLEFFLLLNLSLVF
jgi:predicted AAA+ superfamily ATPase